jgi:hypothetical protein
MIIRKAAALAAVAMIGVLALGTASASATTALRTDPGGGFMSGSLTMRNTASDPFVFSSPGGVLTCNQAFYDWDVNSSTSATAIGGKLTALTFTSCTDTILAINFIDCTLATGSIPAVTITAVAGGGTVAIGDMVVRCATGIPGRACYFTSPSALGNASNAGNMIAYSGVSFAPTTTGFTDGIVPANCGSSGPFGVTLTGIVQGAGSNTVTIAQS